MPLDDVSNRVIEDDVVKRRFLDIERIDHVDESESEVETNSFVVGK